jgi:hypothetical protein
MSGDQRLASSQGIARLLAVCERIAPLRLSADDRPLLRALPGDHEGPASPVGSLRPIRENEALL